MTLPKQKLIESIHDLEVRCQALDKEKSHINQELARLHEELRQLSSEPLVTIGFPADHRTPETPDEKIALFLKLFACRRSVYPKLWENKSKGTKGYSPACQNEWDRDLCRKPQIKCAECPNQAFPPLDENAARTHLQGLQTIGTYAINEDDTCVFLACDFDDDGWQNDVTSYRKAGNDLGIDITIERSRSGNGAHAWIFFTEPVPAELARRLGTLLLTKAQDHHPYMNLKSYDRFFPNQDYLPRGGFGNLIALPLQKNSREQGNSVFLDGALQTIEDQWGYLSEVKRLGRVDLQRVVNEHVTQPDLMESRSHVTGETNDDFILTWDQTILNALADTRIVLPSDTTVTLSLSQQITIPTANLPAKLINKLKRLACFPNPEFYKRNRMRMPTYPHTRFIFSGELRKNALILPRGLLDKAVTIIKSCGATIVIQDQRSVSAQLSLKFSGQLTSPQEKTIDEMMSHDFGVLVAPPGAGKTVMACDLIARRAVPTLILVHRQQLAEQWKARLMEFLSLNKKEIGFFTGTKKKLHGKVDIAMLPTLSRMENIEDFPNDYGQIIVDECHHVPAVSFEDVLKRFPARFVVGLTATPYRKDGLEKILHFQCGPVRHEFKESAEKLFDKRVTVRDTAFRLPDELGVKPPIHVVWHHLIQDVARNTLIVDDVAKSLSESRFPLIISDRKEHLDTLENGIRERQSETSCFRLDGGTSKKRRVEILSELRTCLNNGQKPCLFATASLIGEGFDLPELDTLVLAMPLSFKGRLVQYAGRLHRACTGKTEVRIYDYLDSSSGLTIKMYRNREKTYQAMGYRIENSSKSNAGLLWAQ